MAGVREGVQHALAGQEGWLVARCQGCHSLWEGGGVHTAGHHRKGLACGQCNVDYEVSGL